jgi:subtilisin
MRNCLFSICALIMVLLVILSVLFAPMVLGVSHVGVVRDVIVVFVDVPDVELLIGYGVTVLEVYSIIPAVHAVMSQGVVEQLMDDPAIAYIAGNAQMQTLAQSQTQGGDVVNWAVRQINASSVWVESTGVGVRVAVLDTGISSVDGVFVYGGYNFVDDNLDIVDGHGHGTMLASIIGMRHGSSSGLLGVAPDVHLYAVKVLDDKGVGSLSQAILGVQWAVEHDMHVISISWCINDRNDALKQALAVAYSEGVLIVAAAGNNEVQFGVGCPANYESTIAVSAVKEDARQLDHACTGVEMELTAPGGGVYAVGPDNIARSGTGTSYAAAYVAGVAALIWAKNPALTNTQVRNILCQTATDLQPNDGLDRDIYFGYGLINATAAIQATTPNNPNSTNQPNTNTPKTNLNTTTTLLTISIITTIIITITTITLLSKRYNKNKNTINYHH